MDEKYFVLWGDKEKNIENFAKLIEYISRELGNKNQNEVWDGYYSKINYRSNPDISDILKEIVKGEHVSFDLKERFYHSFGKGGIDFAKFMDSKPVDIVDAVVYPDEKELINLIESLGSKASFIAYGGGTSVTGGLSPNLNERVIISIDLRNMNQIQIDKENMIVETGAGVKGPELEDVLNKSGFTLGHFPESFLHSTVGGWIATNAAGQESNRYGKMKDIVVGVRMITPRGIIEDKIVPNQSSYFGVRDIAIGSEGAYGIITKAVLKIRKLPERLYYDSYLFNNFKDGIDALRSMFSNGEYPLVSRLSDPVETNLSFMGIDDNFKTRLFKRYLGMKGLNENSSLLIIVNEKGKVHNVYNGIHIGSSPAKVWREGRYDRPYLYNALLKRGILADTIETSATWNNIIPIYDNVRTVFQKELNKLNVKGMIMCHLSHEYSLGSAIYFTYLLYANISREEILDSIRNSIVETIISNGGAISHHHGIGRTFKRFLKDYEGLNYEIIKSVKMTLDPDNLMNPGLIDL